MLISFRWNYLVKNTMDWQHRHSKMVSACHRNVHILAKCLLTTITHLLLSSSACRTVTELELYRCCIDVRAPKFWALQSRWFFLCFPSLPLSFSPSSFSSFHSLPCLSSFPILPFLLSFSVPFPASLLSLSRSFPPSSPVFLCLPFPFPKRSYGVWGVLWVPPLGSGVQ